MSTWPRSIEIWKEIRKQKQLAALQASAGCWDPAAHPELSAGSAAYVASIRNEADHRFPQQP